ncbi:spherulation-specific family 4 protein [Streptomyces sp. NPDC048290]|uniref:spherulation-specific family 4 protein n=1 Tax=Streptomyces sp. NPDC048290 TaxID=3155811 RepID=UPI0034378DD4
MSTLLVPYYEHPAVRPAEWAALLAAAPHLYAVVLNPDSGPGARPDPAFADTAARLRAAGVRVLGYTDTDYGRRPAAEVAADLAHHRSWYEVDGAFFDQVPTSPDDFPHYQRLATAAWGTGCATLVLNPGTPPHPCYARIADVLVTFEGPWETYDSQPWRPGPLVQGTHDCHLVYGVPRNVDLAATAHRRGAALHCAVPGTGSHPWGTLPHALRAPR